MDIIDIVKSKSAENKLNISTLTEKYNQVYNKSVLRQSMHKRLKEKTVKYSEIEELADILGYEIVWKKKE